MADAVASGFQRIIGIFPGGGVDLACSNAVKVGDELVAINGTSIQGLGHAVSGTYCTLHHCTSDDSSMTHPLHLRMDAAISIIKPHSPPTHPTSISVVVVGLLSTLC